MSQSEAETHTGTAAAVALGRVIAIAGPPNAGKGTHGAWLAKRLGAEYISGGELLRAEANPEVMAMLAAGSLAPKDHFINVLGAALAAVPLEQPIIVDGPKKPAEAEWLLAYLPKLGRKLERIVFINISEGESRRRSHHRGRHDDGAEEQNERWIRFHEETALSIERYRATGVLVEVDGDAPKEEVFQRVCVALGLPEA